MQFGESNPAIPKANPRDVLDFPPAALAIQAAQTRQLTNTASGGDRLNVGEVADNFEVHPVWILTASAYVDR